ncbi:MAG: recombinase family protein [Pseudomonadota bacterium]
MLYGYARVSTPEQNVGFQIAALKEAGCSEKNIFVDEGVSGVARERPALREVISNLEPGDTLIVWRLDRIARSMLDLVDTVTTLHNRGISFRSLTEHIDLSNAVGEFILHILSAVAAFERALIIERTKAALNEAKARGVILGRPPVINGEMLREALTLLRLGMCVKDVAIQIGVGRSTLYRYLQELAQMPNLEHSDPGKGVRAGAIGKADRAKDLVPVG